jgi:hypothetical protein
VPERAVLIEEINSLPLRYYNEIVDFVGYIKEKKLREYNTLEKAAEKAADEYRNDKELTAFSVLDCEDFYETR